MDATERWKLIAPATDEVGQHRPAPDSRKKRQAVAVACVQCRSGKAKCDGTRPRCTRCRENDLHCQYDVAEGVSRAERMRMLKRDSMSLKVEEMERVMKALRSESDTQATSILARLRLGERVEDVARTLPPTSLAAGAAGNPPNLFSQDSTGTSGSGVSTDSKAIITDSAASPPILDPATPFSSPGHHPSWPSPRAAPLSSNAPSVKGKLPASSSQASECQFLRTLFDRDDFLRSRDPNQNEDDLRSEEDVTVDPRLLAQQLSFDSATVSVASPSGLKESRVPSPLKKQFEKSYQVTQLKNRQPIVNTIRVHPNFDIRGSFNDNIYSSGTQTNNYPLEDQAIQVRDLFIPTWAMMTINTKSDPGFIKEAFQCILREATSMLEHVPSVEFVIEKHPNIAALFDEDEWHRSGSLSKWAASITHSILLKGNDFTAFASMYICWYLMRWMISPSAETYELIPDWLRPTPNQLFMPHISLIDYIVWPAFRDFAVQIPEMQEKMEWMVDMSMHIQCDWPFATDEALRRDDITGMIDLTDLAKASVRDLSQWSVGPTFRAYVSNADSYLRIRTEH